MSASTQWSAQQYVKFESERNRPIRDLLAAIPATDVRAAMDIGCGPGNSTELLQARFPKAEVSGMDNSSDMIEAARQRLPNIAFSVSDITGWAGEELYDVILANAVLQWVPRHEQAFPALLRRLASGGSLAVQMPDNLEEPAHVALRQVAAEAPWASKLEDAARSERHTAPWYYELLRACGATVDVWRTTYHHPLPGGMDAVVDWFKGSALRPIMSRLDAAEGATFIARYRDALAEAYPVLADGSVLLPFPRLFLVATMPSSRLGRA